MNEPTDGIPGETANAHPRRAAPWLAPVLVAYIFVEYDHRDCRDLDHVEAKFHRQADPGLGRSRAEALLEWCWKLEKSGDLDAFADLIEVRR